MLVLKKEAAKKGTSYKALPQKFLDEKVQLKTVMCLNRGEFPKSWKTRKLVLLPKHWQTSGKTRRRIDLSIGHPR